VAASIRVREASPPRALDGRKPAHPAGLLRPLAALVALGLAAALAPSEARAGECRPPTPECHLENGQRLLKSDPGRAAEELRASYELDERTDTLALYATALQLDRRYAHALEVWQRVIAFRESELEAARATVRAAGGSRRRAARAAAAAIQQQMEQAAEAIIQLWPHVGRVRVQLPAGQQLAVSRDGVEVDASRDVLVDAGRDELVFTRRDGSVARVVVEVAAGASAKIDAPPAPVAAAAQPKPAKPVKLAQPKPAAPETPARALAAAEPPAEAVSAPPLVVRVAEEPRARRMSRVGLGLVAGGVVAGGIAGSLGYLASRDYDRAQAGGCAEGRCPAGPAAELAERSNDRARLAQISAVGAGALIATGVTLWIVGRGKARRPAADVALRVAPSSAAIAWRF